VSDRLRAGWLAALVILALYGGLAVSVNFPKAAIDIQSDEATYLAMGYSLAYDGDLEYRQHDLERFRAEWPNGPGGIFLKRGTDVSGLALSASPPFFTIEGRPDPDQSRLYFGKSFAYPLFAAPFVRVFGTNGFLVLNALLLAGAFLAAYFFLSARSPVSVSLLLASAFIFASVMPVYFVWTTPELFNFSLAVIAYFLWLYKHVAPTASRPGTARLRAPASDWVAMGLLGLLTFSKVTNALLVLPPVVWFLWQREWRRAIVAAAIAGAVAVSFFGANVVSSGEWNYQGGPGGDRVTCSDGKYPFETPTELKTWDLCSERGREEALANEIFDSLFWSNLRANLGYFFVGRYGGLVAYFFPAVFAFVTFALARGQRARWQWLVLGGVGLSIAAFIISVPYTYLGGGGSVGNRYFTAVYGLCVFLIPPIRSTAAAVLPWIVGGFFMGKLILNPFQTSIRNFEPAKTGALRMFPVELTNTNDLPYMNESHRVLVWYGSRIPPGFQIYHYDDNAFLKEADGVSFSVRGRSRAEMLIKADPFVNKPDEPLDVRPPKMLRMTLTAGRVPTTVAVELKGGARQEHHLQPDQQWTVWLDLPKPFPFNLIQDAPRAMPASLWVLSISSSDGFSPRTYDPASPDVRFLGVRVTPDLLR
jgi:hypothetical protein